MWNPEQKRDKEIPHRGEPSRKYRRFRRGRKSGRQRGQGWRVRCDLRFGRSRPVTGIASVSVTAAINASIGD